VIRCVCCRVVLNGRVCVYLEMKIAMITGFMVVDHAVAGDRGRSMMGSMFLLVFLRSIIIFQYMIDDNHNQLNMTMQP
jgi:hypothetical protein